MARMTADELRSFLSERTRTLKLATVRRDGRPHVAPVWFLVDGVGVVFTTDGASVKGANIRRDPRVSLCVDDETPPFAFALIEGTATVTTDAAELLDWATRIAARYVGSADAERVGKLNSGAGQMVVRVTPTKVVSESSITG